LLILTSFWLPIHQRGALGSGFSSVYFAITATIPASICPAPPR
jgi:hypothetical protein